MHSFIAQKQSPQSPGSSFKFDLINMPELMNPLNEIEPQENKLARKLKFDFEERQSDIAINEFFIVSKSKVIHEE